ncbi:hypothetical protein RB195_008404 [Necator americanus]|uniref:Serine/threonine specific protein phosphatases domain-containing protein n=1 Tax=Necator americanus TaxID=51031 RepID=A0ABR1CNH2_NECAM
MLTAEPETIELTQGVTPTNINMELFAKNIWNYILNFYPEGPKPTLKVDVLLTLLYKVSDLMEKEPTLLELTGEITVMGPIYGEGDSLITLLSLVGMPPVKTYVFLGCYFGLGFGPFESLLLLMCLKCLYPNKIYLLKGHLEEPASMKNLGLDDMLMRRRVPRDSVLKVSETMMRTVAQMPIGAMIGQRILCLPGGPGPTIREHGLQALRGCVRSSMNQFDKVICMEAAWTVMKLEATPIATDDGIPTFTESQCTAFCKANNLALIVRGRQLVDEGFLNYPKEALTIVSAVAYLDNFRNYAAAVTFQGLNASVIRYKMDEGEPKSLDIVKPGIGRNAMAFPL